MTHSHHRHYFAQCEPSDRSSSDGTGGRGNGRDRNHGQAPLAGFLAFLFGASAVADEKPDEEEVKQTIPSTLSPIEQAMLDADRLHAEFEVGVVWGYTIILCALQSRGGWFQCFIPCLSCGFSATTMYMQPC